MPWNQVQILLKQIQIGEKQTELNQAESARFDAVLLIDEYTQTKNEKLKQVADKRDIITPLLLQNTVAKSELELKLEQSIDENTKLQKLQDSKALLLVQNANIDAEIIKLQNLVDKEQAKSTRLTNYTKIPTAIS